MGKPNNHVVKAWSDESQRLFDRIVQNGQFFSENARLAQELGTKYPELRKKKDPIIFIGWDRKLNGRIFSTNDNVKLVPLEVRPSRNINKRYKFFKTF